MSHILDAIFMFMPLASPQAMALPAPPSEPYRMVYSLAATGEVMMIDLNSVSKTGDVAEAWSLVILAEPLKFADSPVPANVYWMQSRLDCSARTGRFTYAIGMENGRAKFSVPVNIEPTPLATDWPVDEEFICQGRQGARVAATTLADAMAAASKVMNPPVAETQPPVAETPTPPAAE